MRSLCTLLTITALWFLYVFPTYLLPYVFYLLFFFLLNSLPVLAAAPDIHSNRLVYLPLPPYYKFIKTFLCNTFTVFYNTYKPLTWHLTRAAFSVYDYLFYLASIKWTCFIQNPRLYYFYLLFIFTFFPFHTCPRCSSRQTPLYVFPGI